MKKIMLICFIILSLIIVAGCGDKKDNSSSQSSHNQNTSTERKKTPKDQVSKDEMDMFIPAAKFYGLNEQSVHNLVKLLKMEMGVDFSYIKGLKSCDLDGVKFALKAPKGIQLIGDTLWIPPIRKDGTLVANVLIRYENTKDEKLKQAEYVLYDNQRKNNGNIGEFSDIIVRDDAIEKMKNEMSAYVKQINGSAKGDVVALPFLIPVIDPHGQLYLPIIMVGQKYIAASEIYGEKERETGSAMIFDSRGKLLKHYNGNDFYTNFKLGHSFRLRE